MFIHLRDIGFGMQEIIEKLAELRQVDKHLKIFGAAAHRYKLGVTLDEEEVSRFEIRYHCRLPPEYREFLKTVGNGGAGPHYGLFPLGMQDHGHGFSEWSKGYKLVGDLSEEFGLEGPWNLPADYWKQIPDFDSAPSIEEEQRLEEEWEAQLDRDYYGTSIMHGAIPICHEGCALRNWLVINGKFTDTVWRDTRADKGGIAPIVGANANAKSFLAWYLEWLNASLEEIAIN